MHTLNKLIESKKLNAVLYAPLDSVIIESQFWTYSNSTDVDEIDYNTVLKNDVDQTEAAEVLTSYLNDFFTTNKIPTRVAVHTPDPLTNPKTIINPGHPKYHNRLIIGGNQGLAGENNKKGSSKFLMNLFLATYGDNFSQSDIDPARLAHHIGSIIRHEIIHMNQIEARRKQQRISRLDTLKKYRAEGEIPSGDSREDYLSSKIEIDAYAHEIAEELINKHGAAKALDVLRGKFMPQSSESSNEFKEYFVDFADSQFTRRLKRKIFGHIMDLSQNSSPTGEEE
jgi:hypothetical protein